MAGNSGISIEPVANGDDFARCFEIAAAAFGTQTADGIWTAFHPGWETPEGKMAGAARLKSQWSTATVNKIGELNTIFLKATLSDPKNSKIIVGMAIWVQCSTVPGYGDQPQSVLAKTKGYEAIYPGKPSEQKYLFDLIKSMKAQRVEAIKNSASRSPPAIMALDLCCVDPAFQRRGMAAKLVQWGLDEAVRRGGIEAVTEASTAGRTVYERLGFKQEGPEIEYHVDSEFTDRSLPSNVFMRTGRS